MANEEQNLKYENSYFTTVISEIHPTSLPVV